jgi:UDP-glucose 4-epimerase
MKLAWVIGSGGLLGSALCRDLQRVGTRLFVPETRFAWDDADKLRRQFAQAVSGFAEKAALADDWEIYWAAGLGTMGSAAETLAPETQAIAQFLQLLDAQPRLKLKPGTLAFTSSAGAIYGGVKNAVITEKTAPAPTTAYAREKLIQEGLVSNFATANASVKALIARVSTVYGHGQSSGKQQGLLTHMARRILRNQPIQIYVPYDTIRDYIAVDDAAAAMVRAMRTAPKDPPITTRIIASERPTTIAEIVSIFRRIARRAPRVVTSASHMSALYSRRVQFRSITLPQGANAPTKSLLVGISQLMEAERAAFARGPSGQGGGQ